MVRLRSLVARIARGATRAVSHLALAVRPGAPDRPPWERSVLDDIAVRRPWNQRLKIERLWARLRLKRLVEGVTVVIVNWNTKEVLADVLNAVRLLSPPETRILVVDNGSTDGSSEMISGWPGIETICLRSNAGHGVALDLGVMRSRTTVTLTLDSDAIPLREGWLEPAVEPVRSGRASLAGATSSRGFVHPIYLAVSTRDFVRQNLSFQVHRLPGLQPDQVRWGENAWDTAELMTPRVDPGRVVFIERTENPAAGLPGMTTGGVVYHHGGVTRAADGGVSEEALKSWGHACRCLGLATSVKE